MVVPFPARAAENLWVSLFDGRATVASLAFEATGQLCVAFPFHPSRNKLPVRMAGDVTREVRPIRFHHQWTETGDPSQMRITVPLDKGFLVVGGRGISFLVTPEPNRAYRVSVHAA